MAWNQPKDKDAGARPVRQERAQVCTLLRGLIAAFAVVAGAGLAVWLLVGKSKQEVQPVRSEARPGRIADVGTNGTRKAAREVTETRTNRTERAVLGKTPTGKAYVAAEAKTNSNGVVVTRYQLEDGSWQRVVTLQSTDSLVFDTAIDSYLGQLATVPLDQRVPPMPPIRDVGKAFEAAIKRPIVIKDTDSDQVKELKKAVIETRQQICDLMREGYTVEQALAEHESLREKNILFRRDLQKELNEVYRNEGREAAESYMRTANEKLKKQGVIPLILPNSGTSRKRNEQQ